MSGYELAQLNVAIMKEPLESPGMADFVANLERINALADASPGFVWRLETEEGDATALRPLGESMLVNMSVWQDHGVARALRLQVDACRDHAPPQGVVPADARSISRALVDAERSSPWSRRGC